MEDMDAYIKKHQKATNPGKINYFQAPQNIHTPSTTYLYWYLPGFKLSEICHFPSLNSMGLAEGVHPLKLAATKTEE